MKHSSVASFLFETIFRQRHVTCQIVLTPSLSVIEAQQPLVLSLTVHFGQSRGSGRGYLLDDHGPLAIEFRPCTTSGGQQEKRDKHEQLNKRPGHTLECVQAQIPRLYPRHTRKTPLHKVQEPRDTESRSLENLTVRWENMCTVCALHKVKPNQTTAFC